MADVVDLAAASRMNSYVLDQMGTLLTWSVQDRSNMIQNVSTTDAGLASMTGDRIVSVDAGWNTVMAVTQNGDVWVKGDNSKGQLGFPVDPTAPETPVDPFTKSADLSGQDVRDVVGGTTALALKGNGNALTDTGFGFTGTLVAAGANDAGQLGDGTTADRDSFGSVLAGDTAGLVLTPKDPTGEDEQVTDDMRNAAISGVVQADTAMGLNLRTKSNQERSKTGLSSAITFDGSVYTWGANDYGQMGNRIIGMDPLTGVDNEVMPNYVNDLRLALKNEPEGVYNNRFVYVYRDEDNTSGGGIYAGWKLRPLIYWFNVYYELPVELNENAEYMFESTNKEVVEVTADGELIYKGVGAATIMVYEKNTELKTMLEVEVVPYSSDYYKKTENNEVTDELAYKLTAPALATGWEFSVALTANGYVYAWGNNGNGQVGQNQMREQYYDTFQPVQSGNGPMRDIVSVAAGSNFALAAHKDGYVYAWGYNVSGSLGQNVDLSTLGSYPTPLKVKGPDGTGYLGDARTGKIVKVFAYGNSAAALTEKGQLYVWGASAFHQLGARDDAIVYAYPHKVPGLNHVQEVYISENNMVIQTEGTEIWVSGRQDTRITGWGDTRPDNGKDWAYDAESVYPLPMLNNTQTDYQDAVASVGLGAKQVILLTMEYDQYTENGAEKELLDKHVYMLGQDTQSLLGTLLQTEETEETETTGNTEAYVNEPTEYSFFNITELERLKELAQEALETLEKNGNRYDGDWQIKWNTFNAKYAEARAALVAEGITDPSDREIRAKLDKMAVGDTMLQIIIDYCNTNPDWVLVALNMAGQNVIKAQREVRAAEETLAKSEKSKSDRDAVVASWAKLMAEVQASNEYLTYKPLLDEQQAALKAYDEAKTNYNTAVEEAATAASTLTAAVTAQTAAAE